MVLLSFGIPGGMELAVIFMILVSLAIPVILVVAFFRYLGDRSSSDLEDRVANLEGQVAALREGLQEDDDE